MTTAANPPPRMPTCHSCGVNSDVHILNAAPFCKWCEVPVEEQTMKTWLEIQRQDQEPEKRAVREDGSVGVVTGACPGCNASPFRVQCGNPQPMHDDRTIRAGARCVDCGDNVGWVYHETATLFGLHEDRMVAARARVY